ncbi:iron-sulfur cluster assembly protein [Rhizobium calliandrae]|uniref:Iron-sulfur cluster assembly protein n=1 Tax=Rhizobium calliandrae TaxID=1312182 RepID=A0ABT7KFS5_9HYPH|nr:iron-sulfur cluster assembly protein [Rhizobium calliandrae]MDL2407475.1 iron-sulfur cluster assembly protein [Rhizobium calliandrae]
MILLDQLESRQRELWRRLEGVNDPELDEPVTEMGFVEKAQIAADGHVDIDFRLPTYWCSPNFAFLMLEDVRTALESLSWSSSHQITLHDHMFAQEVNRGVSEGKTFAEIFGSLAEDTDLDALRGTFKQKAFKRRQESVILDFRRMGLSDARIVAMTMDDFDSLAANSDEAAKGRARYREALQELRQGGLQPQDAAILRWDGKPIEAEALAPYLADLRSVRINMEFNGALCRGLKQTRYKEVEMIDGEPTLVDFILDRVPAPQTVGCSTRS